jgi:2-keto-4-pentenoate hydratase/2-oxohepta-3-ene-1,7-dioic acid hydratase in catechol pathway
MPNAGRFPVGVALINAISLRDETVLKAIAFAQKAAADGDNRFTVGSGDIIWAAPVHDTRQIIAVGLNYMSHCLEQNIQPPTEPRFFAKLVSSMTGHNSTVTLWPISTQIDYEGELGVVIGRETKAIDPARALDHVFGYTIVNDVTARDLQKSDHQWTRAKGLDTFCPIGPFVTTADEISDPDDLRIITTVNGEIRQNCPTSDMIFGVAECISRISQAITLQPGDIISTGTPAGVGLYMKPPRFLSKGDTVNITIERLGTLTNRFVETVLQ